MAGGLLRYIAVEGFSRHIISLCLVVQRSSHVIKPGIFPISIIVGV